VSFFYNSALGLAINFIWYENYKTVGRPHFSPWKIRPIDTRGNREAVVESIKKATRNNNGIFPEAGDTFIEKSIQKE
jgi:hypothetical protein